MSARFSSRDAGIAAVLLLAMFTTRGAHLDLGLALPDATLAAFALGGLWLASPAWFAGLCAAALAIDVYAVTFGGVSAACFSWAYPFLMIAYACPWIAGRHARAYGPASSRARLLLALPVAWLGSFVASSGSYYAIVVAGRTPFAQYAAANAGFAAQQLAWTGAYVAAGLALAALAGGALPRLARDRG